MFLLFYYFKKEKYSFAFSLSSCFSLLWKSIFVMQNLCLLILKFPFFSLHFPLTKKPFQQVPFQNVFFSLFPPFVHPLSLVLLFLSLRVFSLLFQFFVLFTISFFLDFYCLFVFSIYNFLYNIFVSLYTSAKLSFSVFFYVWKSTKSATCDDEGCLLL